MHRRRPGVLACAAELRRHGIAVTIFDNRELARRPEYLRRRRVQAAALRQPARSGHDPVAWAWSSARRKSAATSLSPTSSATTTSSSSASGSAPWSGSAFRARAAQGVIDALRFIERYKTLPDFQVGRRVIVIGGGNTAIDAANAAGPAGRRGGSPVLPRGPKTRCRRSPSSTIIRKLEGVQFHWLAQPVEIVERDGIAHRGEVRRDAPGRARCQRPPQAGADPGHGVCRRVRHGDPRARPDPRCVDPRSWWTGRHGPDRNPKYYAGGDCVNGGREVVDAVADGKRAAVAHAGGYSVADLTTNFAGIRCPNPFWLASGPPANCGDQVMRAFDAGWGGAVWKTLGDPIVNVSSRYSSVDWNGQRMMGLNNIELITDRPLDVNLREIAEVKKRYPHHAVIASLMVESKREAWHDIVKRSEDAGADGLELNFGCPHGMSERGMGSAVGQVPDYSCMITEWVKEVARTPVLVKLTPNITDIRTVGAARRSAAARTRSPPSTPSTPSPASISTR